ncbi:hypothetical protein [Nocardioides lijunqiniae]|uniref:hypothetical protein n=1 Tax=Nocardioides lijunqiniae TaxID=2760832 RepID=UPI00187810EF|nr:hypothetical protein [Nocardioides lijunqiniae]
MRQVLRDTLPWCAFVVGGVLLAIAGRIAEKDWPRDNTCFETEVGPCSAPATYGDQDAALVAVILGVVGVCLLAYGAVQVLKARWRPARP